MTENKKVYIEDSSPVVNTRSIKNSSIYEEFLTNLTPEKIKHFNNECKKKQLNLKQTKVLHDHSVSKLPKENFMILMNSIFGNDLRKKYSKKDIQIKELKKKTDTKDKMILILFEKMFNRFKTVKCEISLEKNRINPLEHIYHVNEFNTEHLQEIDTYEFSCALCIFLKLDFKEKLKLLFDLTDSDDDGYINEAEIKNLIFKVNYIFCDEDHSLKTNSSIINQSLNNIKSSRVFEAISKFPGGLSRILSLEKYVNFDQLYDSISKIENYENAIIPSFINFENCLNIRKSEPEYEISERNLNDYLAIVNENVNTIKETNNEIFFKTKSKDLRKIYDTIKEIDHNKIIKKKKEFVSENKKNISQTNKKLQKVFLNSGSSELFKNTLPPISKSSKGDKDKALPKINIKNNSDNEHFTINLNKILRLEAQPGKIRFKEITFKEKENFTIPTEESKETSKILTNLRMYHQTKDHFDVYSSNHYVMICDILNEIKSLSNKNNVAHFEDSEEIKKLLNQSTKIANSLKNKFRDTAQNMNYSSFSKIENGNHILKN